MQVQIAKEQNDYPTAEKLLKKELRKSRDKIPIWIALGKLNIEQKKWFKARGWFDKVEENQPDNIQMLYYQGICEREIGKFKALFLQSMALKESDKYFKRVINTDSMYLDVWYQYALLERDKKKYTAAIEKAIHQVQLKPFLENANIGLYFLYRSFLLNKPYDEVKEWLIHNTNRYSSFFLAELYRQNDHLTVADSIYQQLLQKSLPISNTPLYLALVRLKIVQKKPLDAESTYWKAVDSIKDSLDARFIFEDLKYICTDDEVAKYRALKQPHQWQIFFRKFWLKRNPLPATPDNLRLIEHYRRMIYAEKYFRYDGYRTWNANPDQQEFLHFPKAFYLNKEFNDKGLVYIRHGKPDDKATALGEAMAYNESWLYKERGGLPKLIFHFEIDEDGLAGDWRLTPMLRDSAAIGAVVMWDAAYERYLRGDANIRNRVANEIAIESQKEVEIGLSTDRHSWEKPVKPLHVDFSLANFRDKNNRDFCELHVGFPVNNLLKKIPADSHFVADMGVAVFDLQWNEYAKKDEMVQISPGLANIVDGYFIKTYLFKLAPRNFIFALHVDPLKSPELGGMKFRVGIPNFSSPQLSCSDILLAYQIKAKNSTQKVSRTNMDFLPNPGKRFPKGAPLHVYVEIYNLTKNNAGRTNYTVTYTVEDAGPQKKSGFLGLFGGKKQAQISLKSERQGTSEMEPEYTVLDVSAASPGKKKLYILIQDENSKQNTEAETIFRIEK